MGTAWAALEGEAAEPSVPAGFPSPALGPRVSWARWCLVPVPRNLCRAGDRSQLGLCRLCIAQSEATSLVVTSLRIIISLKPYSKKKSGLLSPSQVRTLKFTGIKLLAQVHADQRWSPDVTQGCLGENPNPLGHLAGSVSHLGLWL